jgi:hypothetical protein
MRTLHLLLPTLLVAVGCSTAPTLPPPGSAAAIRVAPVENATGRDLLVRPDRAGWDVPGLRSATIPHVIGDELQRGLAARGFALGGPEADVLTVRITRWEPELSTDDWVTLSLDATLTGADGAVRWRTSRPDVRVLARHQIDQLAVAGDAALLVAQALIDDWRGPAW